MDGCRNGRARHVGRGRSAGAAPVEARRCRFWNITDPTTRTVARGLLQHFRDDAVFHESRAFAELSLELTVMSRDALGGPSGLGPRFLGHLLVELLLDAALVAEAPDRLDAYYRAMESVDGRVLQEAVNRMAPRRTERLAPMFSAIVRERFLWDYLDDARLWRRLNQIMRRVGLDALGEGFQDVLAPRGPGGGPSVRASVGHPGVARFLLAAGWDYSVGAIFAADPGTTLARGTVGLAEQPSPSLRSAYRVS